MSSVNDAVQPEKDLFRIAIKWLTKEVDGKQEMTQADLGKEINDNHFRQRFEGTFCDKKGSHQQGSADLTHLNKYLKGHNAITRKTSTLWALRASVLLGNMRNNKLIGLRKHICDGRNLRRYDHPGLYTLTGEFCICLKENSLFLNGKQVNWPEHGDEYYTDAVYAFLMACWVYEFRSQRGDEDDTPGEATESDFPASLELPGCDCIELVRDCDWHECYYKNIPREDLLALQRSVDGSVKPLVLPQVLYYDNFDGQSQPYDSNQLKIQITETYKIDDELDKLISERGELALAYLQKVTNYYESHQLALKRIFHHKTNLIMSVKTVYWPLYVRTNYCLNEILKDKEHTLREEVNPGGTLDDLDHSRLANVMGVNYLLFTQYGSMIMLKRAQNVSIRPGELCSASSGGASAPNSSLKPGDELKDFPLWGEPGEEMTIHEEDMDGGMVFLGVTRELSRGGQAESFFYGKTRLSKVEVYKKWGISQHKEESDNVLFHDFGTGLAFEALDNREKQDQFFVKINELLDDNKPGIISAPLLANIAFWVKYRMLGYN